MQQRNKEGKYGSKARRVGTFVLLAVFTVSVFGWTYAFGFDASKQAANNVVTWIVDRVHPETIVKNGAMLPTVSAEVIPSMSVEQLEAKLDAIVWGGESDKHVMDDGEIYPTFDPPQSLLAVCSRIGGKMNNECVSYGPRQEKISMLQAYWPGLHSGEKITDKSARDCAEDNDCSRQFFLQCAEYVKGCANKWTTFVAHKTEAQIYLDLIRETKKISL